MKKTNKSGFKMNKHLIIFGIAVLLICVGLSGCIGDIERASSDTGTCCVLGIIGFIFFILLIAYLLGGKKTVVHTYQSAPTKPPVIIHKETPQEKSKSDRYCPSCGRVIPFDAKLCPYCGKKFKNHFTEKQEEEEPDKYRFCTKCGEKLEEGDEFCINCGTKAS